MPKDEQKAEYLLAQLEALGALEDGKVDLLVDYLMGDGPISPAFRQHLAAMLQPDGETTYRFEKPIGRRRGELGWSEEVARNARKMEVGVFMERRVRAYGKGGYEAAFLETTTQFEIGKTKLQDAHKHVRNIIEKYTRRDKFTDLNESYPEPKDLRSGVQRVTNSE